MLSKIELPSAGVFLCPFLIEVNGLQYYGTRLSENISRREPEGYLLCLNVPVARTGTQEYLPEELGLRFLFSSYKGRQGSGRLAHKRTV